MSLLCLSIVAARCGTAALIRASLVLLSTNTVVFATPCFTVAASVAYLVDLLAHYERFKQDRVVLALMLSVFAIVATATRVAANSAIDALTVKFQTVTFCARARACVKQLALWHVLALDGCLTKACDSACIAFVGKPRKVLGWCGWVYV